MRSVRPFVLVMWMVGWLVGANPVVAQAPADSLREYELGEVVVGSEDEVRAAPSTLQRIPLAAVDRLDAVAMDRAVRLIPAAHVQTNSRGETLVYLRAAGERQVALFFDGALLNIPWDNRIDLGLPPSGVVGGITITKGVLLFGLNALTSAHRQQEADFEDGRRSEAPLQTYRQGLYSVGLEAEASPLAPLRLTAGLSLDALTTPETGDKPVRDPFVDYGVTAGGVYRLNNTWAFNASVGRKTRFPTLRELFGEALSRFLANPDLRPESSLLVEARFRREGERLSGEATLFLNRTDDTIDQRRLEDGRRQRVNLGGSRIVGVEVAGAVRPLQRIRLDGHLTVMRVRGIDEEDVTTRLSEKPEVLGRLAASYNPGLGPNATFVAVYTGKAFSPDGPGSFARLAPSLVLNARAGYRLFVREVAAEVFVRVDDLTDAVVLPQLGLPGPGREVQAGLKLAL